MRRLLQWLHSFAARPLVRTGVGVGAGIFSTLFFAANALAQAAGNSSSSIVGGTQATQSPGIVDTVLGFLAEMLVHLTSVVNDVMIALLDVVITIMQYNRFTSSPVVSAGWSIVRDAVNMFFVVALIAIAVGTIVGYSKFQWSQQVPRLLIFALVINFSKTLCGIMIDVGQVVMLTFANALRNVAAGNFIQLFSISVNKLRDTGQPITDFALFGGALVGFLISLWVLATVLALVAILAWRIVYLWVLITLSPLTWFVGGLGNLTHSHAYAEWWEEFTCMVVVGPVLTFFLWLTLVVAGAGNIAASEFGLSAVSPNLDVSQNVIDVLGSSQLLSFIIAAAMMYAGFRAANSFCEGAKGVTGSALSWGRAGWIGSAKKAGGYVAQGGAEAGRLGLRGAGAAVERSGVANTRPVLLAQKGLSQVKSAGINAGAAFGLGAAGKQSHAIHEAETLEQRANTQESIGDIAGAAATRAKATEERSHAAAFGKESLGELATLSSEDKAKYLAGVAGKGELNATDEKKAQMLFAEAAGDQKARKALDEAGVLGTLYEKLGGKKQIGNTIKGDKDLGGKFGDFLASRPDITGDFGGITNVAALEKVDPKALAALSKDDAFRKHLEGLDSGRFEDVKNADGTTTKKPLNLLEYTEQGRLGGKARGAWQKGLEGYYAGMSGEELAKQNVENIAPYVSADTFSKTGGEKVAQKIMGNAKASDLLQGRDAAAFAAASQKVTSDAGKFQEFIAANPLALGNLREMDATNPANAQAAGHALGKEQVGQLLTQYKKASADDRAKLVSTMDRAQAALDAAGSSLAGKFKAERERFEGQAVQREESAAPKVLASREADLSRITADTGRLAAQAETLGRDLAEAQRQIRVEREKPNADSGKISAYENAAAAIEEQRAQLNAARQETESRLVALQDEIRSLRNAQSVADAKKQSEQG
jgi:hypothetical protein